MKNPASKIDIFNFILIFLSVFFSFNAQAQNSQDDFVKYTEFDIQALSCIKEVVKNESSNRLDIFLSRLEGINKENLVLINHNDIYTLPETFRIFNIKQKDIRCSSVFSLHLSEVLKNLIPDLPSIKKYRPSPNSSREDFFFECESQQCFEKFQILINNERIKLEKWAQWRTDEHNQAQLKKLQLEKEESELAEITRKTGQNAIANADKSDLIAQVLNYSSGCNDDGCPNTIWIKNNQSKCDYIEHNKHSGKVINSIKLNDYDPKSIKISTLEKTETLPDPFVRGKYIQKTYNVYAVKYEGRNLFLASNLDPDRLKRGWNLIYSKFCKGSIKAF